MSSELTGNDTFGRTVNDPAQFGRVAVVMGGSSAEREVSLDSGRNVLDALRASGVDAHPIDGIPALLDALRAGHFARVFNILHGRRRRRGRRAAGRARFAARAVHRFGRARFRAVAWTRSAAKQVWQAIGLPTPTFVRPAHAATTCTRRRAAIGFPLIVKPASEGSSVGVTRVFDEAGLDAAVELPPRYPRRHADGNADRRRRSAPSACSAARCCRRIHIVPKGEFYDYNAKYVAEDTQYICPGLRGRRRKRDAARALVARVRRARLHRLGPRRRDARPPGPQLAARGEHGAGHDHPFAGAEGRGRRRHRFRQTLCWRILETSFAEGETGHRTNGGDE